MYNLISKGQEKTIARDRARLAIHEAGHAVTFWLFDIGTINFIEMTPTADFWARVNRHDVFGSQPSIIASMSEYSRRLALVNARLRVIGCLAGRCCEDRAFNGGGDWFAQLLADDDAMFDPGSDISQAGAYAAALYDDRAGQSMRFLEVSAAWTDELFAMPRVWAAVEALAARLRETDRLAGRVAERIIASSWGRASGLPWRELSPKWRRRLSVSSPETGGSRRGNRVAAPT